ncbi:MAG: methyltransferase [Pseudomonadota bacterium]
MMLTRDAFLDGKLQITQPAGGYRAATDPVFLAAACPAKGAETVLELGCGAGVAALCLMRRVSGVLATGVEVQPEYASLARQNAQANRLPLTVVEADIAALPGDLRERNFDHVIFNPPFFEGGHVVGPTDAGREMAHVESNTLAQWCDVALRRLAPKGTVTVIQRAERLGDILAGLGPRVGGVKILPMAAREGRAAGRVMVQAKKSSKAPLQILPPFLVHDGALHLTDGDDFSAAARAVLRDGGSLPLG